MNLLEITTSRLRQSGNGGPMLCWSHFKAGLQSPCASSTCRGSAWCVVEWCVGPSIRLPIPVIFSASPGSTIAGRLSVYLRCWPAETQVNGEITLCAARAIFHRERRVPLVEEMTSSRTPPAGHRTSPTLGLTFIIPALGSSVSRLSGKPAGVHCRALVPRALVNQVPNGSGPGDDPRCRCSSRDVATLVRIQMAVLVWLMIAHLIGIRVERSLI